MEHVQKVDAYLRDPSEPLTTSVLRYNGFWNDVGEALKSFLPRSIYIGSYLATGIYAGSAVYYKNQRLIREYGWEHASM